MEIVLTALIILFGLGSYAAGLYHMWRGSYAPSVFSRVVWLLLAVNGFAGVVLSGSSAASMLLAGIFLLGSAATCILSFWRGTRRVSRVEYICLGLLVISGVIWVSFRAPLINLVISLIAHFIGAIPTYERAWHRPSSESTAFWSLFFIASLLSVAASWGTPFSLALFPIYFSLFDGSMFLLSIRKIK